MKFLRENGLAILFFPVLVILATLMWLGLHIQYRRSR
ncbi:MAG: hypothetical protein JWO52_4122 [Gammaproteobacteria bacterium]|nr:hypothetical protein [Gammaproteobacteria bacterium]